MCCSQFYADCAVQTNDPNIVVAQNKRKFIVKNPNKHFFCKVKIDSCYDLPGKKCDFLIVDCNRNDFYFIELKGKNLTHALEQLEETIHHFKNLHSGKIHAIVVQSRTPKETVKVKNFIKKFRSKGIHLKTQNAIFEITL